MLQISAVLSELTKEQREAIAAFITSFPSSNLQNNDEDTTIIPAFTVPSDEGEQSPEEAFEQPGPVLVGDADSRLDKAGIPWDERIHASSRVKTAEGLWRKKRGVDDATVTHVEAELKALMAIPAPAPVPTSAAASTVTVAAASQDSPSVIAAVPAPPAAADRSAFVALVGKASAAIAANKLSQDELTAAAMSAGVASFPLLAHRLDLVPQVVNSLDVLIESRA